MIIRYTPEMLKDLIGLYDDQTAEDDDELDDEEIIKIKNHLQAQIDKATIHYKPIRIFIIIETFGHVGSILAMVARKNKLVMATINEVGRRQLSEIHDNDVKTKEYSRRLGHFLLQHHPHFRAVSDLSDDKPFIVNEI